MLRNSVLHQFGRINYSLFGLHKINMARKNRMDLESLCSGILFCISLVALIIACLAFTKKNQGVGGGDDDDGARRAASTTFGAGVGSNPETPTHYGDTPGVHSVPYPYQQGFRCSTDADCAYSMPCKDLGRGKRCISNNLKCWSPEDGDTCGSGYYCCLGNDGYNCRECNFGLPCARRCEATCAAWHPPPNDPAGPETCVDS